LVYKTLNDLEQRNARRRALSLRELSFLCKSQWHTDKLSDRRRASKRPAGQPICIQTLSDLSYGLQTTVWPYVFYPRQRYTGLLWTIAAESQWSVRWNIRQKTRLCSLSK